MVATHRKEEPLRVGVNPAFEFANFTPLQVRRIVVLLGACHLTAVASDAPGHVEVESVLFPCGWLRFGESALRRSAPGAGKFGF